MSNHVGNCCHGELGSVYFRCRSPTNVNRDPNSLSETAVPDEMRNKCQVVGAQSEKKKKKKRLSRLKMCVRLQEKEKHGSSRHICSGSFRFGHLGADLLAVNDGMIDSYGPVIGSHPSGQVNTREDLIFSGIFYK